MTESNNLEVYFQQKINELRNMKKEYGYVANEIKINIVDFLKRKKEDTNENWDKLRNWYKEWNIKLGGAKDFEPSYDWICLLQYIKNQLLKDLAGELIKK